MKKFFVLFSLSFFCALYPAAAPDPDYGQDRDRDGDYQDGEIVCSIPRDKLQIIYLRNPNPESQKPAQPDLEIKEEEEKFASEQNKRKSANKKHPSHARSISSNGSYVFELQRMMADPDLIQVICPHCTEVQMVLADTDVECFRCSNLFTSPAIPASDNRKSAGWRPGIREFGDQEFGIREFDNDDFGANYMPDYAPLSQEELTLIKPINTHPVRQSMGKQDCAVHALANALAINTALLNSAQPVLAPARKAQDQRAQNQQPDIKKLMQKSAHDVHYDRVKIACNNNTYNLSSDAIQQALQTLQEKSLNLEDHHMYTNIFVVDNVAELQLLRAIRQAMLDLPSQPDQDPRAAIHFICNTRPQYRDYNGNQAGKHWVTLSLIKQKDRIFFYFSDSNHGNIPTTLHPLIRILAERYGIIAPNKNPQYEPPQEQSSTWLSIFKWLAGF